MKIPGVIKDIQNYFFLRKTIKRLKQTEEWNKFELRVDWINRIYTVLNVKKEDKNHSATQIENDTVARALFIETLQPITDYLMQQNLGEILKPQFRMIENNDVQQIYLVYFRPLFLYLDFGWIFTRASFLVLLYLAYKNINFSWFFNIIYSWISNLPFLK